MSWFRKPFGAVWGTIFGAFRRILKGFPCFEKVSKFQAEVGRRKSGLIDTGVVRDLGLAALIMIVGQSGTTIKRRTSASMIESLVVGMRRTRFVR